MSAVMNAEGTLAAPQSIYDQELRERLREYYEGTKIDQWWRSAGFEPFWQKFQGGVLRELNLAHLVSHWVPLRDARVLVIGSYLGTEAVAYALCGARVVGIDLDKQATDISLELAARHGVEIKVCPADACDTGLPAASFDYISCAQVLEHLWPHDQTAMLQEIWRLCKPGGYFWIDTPNQMRFLDQHDTGLPLIHWLPRRLKVPLARMLGRAVTLREPAMGDDPIYLHYYLSYFKIKRVLADLGRYEVVSRYRGYADVDHYAAGRKVQGRDRGTLFALKIALLRQLLKVWDWNWFGSTRVMIHKCEPSKSLAPKRVAA